MPIQHQAASKRENFPVASFWLPPRARNNILILYDFLRGADDISDNPKLEAQERKEALDAIVDAFHSHRKQVLPPWAKRYYELVNRGQLRAYHGDLLLQAFMQDTQKTRYQNWAELIGYCSKSAAPVGRAVLELCQERDADIEASDALCSVLQIINHIQDMKDDFQQLDRIYLPQDWMKLHKVSEAMLAKGDMSLELRALMNHILDECDAMVEASRPIISSIQSTRLRIQIATIWQIAKALIEQLRHNDPLAQKVKLSKQQQFGCLIRGMLMR